MTRHRRRLFDLTYLVVSSDVVEDNETELKSCRHQQQRFGSGRLHAFPWHPGLGSVETVDIVAGL